MVEQRTAACRSGMQHPFKGGPCAYAALVSMTWTLPCRGDAAKLPQQVLDLCEIEPLRQEEPGSTRCAVFWV